jgi:alcohol dehydrogenase class IV
VPHAQIHALVLPYAMRWNLDVTVEQHARMARAAGIDAVSEEEAARSMPQKVFEMNQQMGLPLKLRELGIPRDGLEQLSLDALNDYSIHTNPRPVRSPDQVLEVLEMAW